MPEELPRLVSEAQRRDLLTPELRGLITEAQKRGISVIGGAPRPSPPRSNTERLIGAADMTAHFMSGALNQAFNAGPSGVFEVVGALVEGDSVEEALKRGGETVEERSGGFPTIPLQTAAGEEGMQTIGPVFQAIDRATTFVGERLGRLRQNKGPEATESFNPEAATVIKTGLDMLPVTLSGRRPRVGDTPITLRQRQRDIKELEAVADRQGVDLSAPQSVQREQIVETAERRVDSQAQSAQNFDLIQRAVSRAAFESRNAKNAKYTTARETGELAGTSPVNVGNLKDSITNVLEGFDLDVPEMRRVRNQVQFIEELAGREVNSIVTINELAKFNRRNNVRTSDESANAALSMMGSITRSWLDDIYNNDMMTGDPQAIRNWQIANAANAEYRKNFKDLKPIRNMVEQEATPEMVKNWIFGSNAVGAKKESSIVVERLKQILGDGTEIAALRQEVLFDVLEPLLREEPSFRTFARRYDQFRRNNQSLEKELLPDSEQALGELRQLAAAVERSPGQAISIDLSRGVAVAMFGHEIAQQGFKVSLARSIIDRMTGQSDKTRKRQIMADMLGYDPKAPLIPLAPALSAGVMQTGVDQLSEEEREAMRREILSLQGAQ